MVVVLSLDSGYLLLGLCRVGSGRIRTGTHADRAPVTDDTVISSFARPDVSSRPRLLLVIEWQPYMAFLCCTPALENTL